MCVCVWSVGHLGQVLFTAAEAGDAACVLRVVTGTLRVVVVIVYIAVYHFQTLGQRLLTDDVHTGPCRQHTHTHTHTRTRTRLAALVPVLDTFPYLPITAAVLAMKSEATAIGDPQDGRWQITK